VADGACPGRGCVPPGDGVVGGDSGADVPGMVKTVWVAGAPVGGTVTDGAPVREGTGVSVALAGTLDGAGADVSVGICGAGVAVSPPDSVAVGFGLGVDVTSRVGEGTVWRKGCMFFAAQACGPMPYSPPAIKRATTSGIARNNARESGKAFRFFMVGTSSLFVTLHSVNFNEPYYQRRNADMYWRETGHILLSQIGFRDARILYHLGRLSLQEYLASIKHDDAVRNFGDSMKGVFNAHDGEALVLQFS